MAITDRYASSIHSSNLKSQAENSTGDVEILGAFGIADKCLTAGKNEHGEDCSKHPLAVPLERLFAGDNGAAHEIVRILAKMVFERSWRVRVKISQITAHDMACACLAWHRNGVCRPCGGHGKTIIPGSKSFSDHDCQVCRETGKIVFESQFKPEHRELARWLLAEMELESGQAGPAAMKALASTLELLTSLG